MNVFPGAEAHFQRVTDISADPWVAIQRNPSSGAGGHRAHLIALIHSLRQLGFHPRVFSDRERLARRLADPAQRDSLACIVAAGGDGTFRDIINRYPGIRVAILPLGTENLVARHLRIPKSGPAVAAMIAAGHVRRMDLGAIRDRRFVIMASAGIDAEVIHRVHARRKGNIHRLNYVQPILQSFRNYPYPDLRIWVDDATTPYVAKLAVLVNLPAYALGLQIAASAKEDDGILDLRLFERGSAFQMCRYIYNVALGRHERLPDVRIVPTTRIRIEADVPVPIQVDGDPEGWTPAEIRVLPAAVEVIAPAPAPSRAPALVRVPAIGMF